MFIVGHGLDNITFPAPAAAVRNKASLSSSLSGSVLCPMLCVVNVCPVHAVDLN